MFLDPLGIARASKWGSTTERIIGEPDWVAVCQELSAIYEDTHELMTFAFSLAVSVTNLPDVMHQVGVEEGVISDLLKRSGKIAEDLRKAGKEL